MPSVYQSVYGRDASVYGRDTSAYGRDTSVYGRDTSAYKRELENTLKNSFIHELEMALKKRRSEESKRREKIA